MSTVLTDASGRGGTLALSLRKAIDWLDRVPYALLALPLRAAIATIFWNSGTTKLADWDATLQLFREDYRVPLLPPELAAYAGTAGELLFPLLLVAGFASRAGALGLAAVNALAVVSYAHVLLAEGFEAAFAQHVLWGYMLAVLATCGPGALSLDAALARRAGAARA